MINVIGVGDLGCAIAERFEEDKHYKTFYLSFAHSKSRNSRKIPQHNNPQQIEDSCPSLNYLFKEARGESIVFIPGGELISSISLRVLEALNGKSTTVFYIEPPQAPLRGDVKLNENVVFHVLQEYSRSDAIDKVVIISEEKLEKAIGDAPVISFQAMKYDFIASTVKLLSYFSNSPPVLEVVGFQQEHSKICTISVVDMSSMETKRLYDLNFSTEMLYYFGINETDLQNDNKLMNKIKEISNSRKGDLVNISYKVFSTTYEDPQILCLEKTMIVQERIEDENLRRNIQEE